MSIHRLALFAGGSILTLALVSGAAAQGVVTSPPPSDDQAESLGEIVVTAQKRSESISRVGMSITAATGEALIKQGVTDVSQLTKVVPGFNFNSTGYGTPVYSIRGIGFQENSLGASPAVTVYVDEIPVPFSLQTLGASLDLERVEVLKGPQGTLFGSNSTGGAINYVAAKPTDSLAYGADLSVGRFFSTDVSGFVSGPLSSTLKVRVSGRYNRSDAWQVSQTRDAKLGKVDQLIGRILLDWKPTDHLKVSLNLNGWRDHSDTQAAQKVAVSIIGIPAFLAPGFTASPVAPADNRAADWDPNNSFRQNNRFYQASGRIDYDITDDLVLTSISSYEKYKRLMPVDTDGTSFQNFFPTLGGETSTFFQEVRLGGKFSGGGNWIIGGNYQHDTIFDTSLLDFPASSQSFLGRTSRNEGRQVVSTKGVFANVNFPLTAELTAQGGIRYTAADRSFVGCTRDAGDGIAAGSGFFPGSVAGGCLTFLLNGSFGLVSKELNEDNVSWRLGLNYQANPDTLIYANVSKGYKSGSFPLLGLAFEPQATPVTQESVMAYEAGIKAKVASNLRINAAGFYYDYNNKQIRSYGVFPIFNLLETLINVPKSRVAGFEVDAVWQPVDGLTIRPNVTLVDSKITRNFAAYTGDAVPVNVNGEPFPYTPKWSGSTDVEYRWEVGSSLEAFAGTNVSYRTGTNGSLGNPASYAIAGYTLVDLRAGVEGEGGRWRASVWGRNVGNKYYWIAASHISDNVVRFAGRPVTYGVTLTVRN